MVASCVKEHAGLLFPVLVLLSELGHELLQEQANLLAACVHSAQRKENFATCVNSCDKTQPRVDRVRRLRVTATLWLPAPASKICLIDPALIYVNDPELLLKELQNLLRIKGPDD